MAVSGFDSRTFPNLTSEDLQEMTSLLFPRNYTTSCHPTVSSLSSCTPPADPPIPLKMITRLLSS